MPDTEEKFLRRRYLAALLLVAALILAERLLVQRPLEALAVDAPVINLAGRQRMLGQKLAKAALILDRAEGRPDRPRLAAEMDALLARWTAVHDGLRFGNPALALPEGTSPAIRAALEAIDPPFRKIRGAAARLAVGPSATDLASILATEDDYLTRMDRIVGMYEAEARERVRRFGRLGWLLSGLSLLGLLGIGVFILAPAGRLIRRQFAELREARDALEARVLERTAALALESEERSRAEARHRTLLEQFSHVSRTTTLGEMAGGLAHELNQPLGAAANYVEGCLVALEHPSPRLDEIRKALEKALASTLKAGEIIRRIRRFVTRHSAELERFEANRAVEEVAALFRDEATRLRIPLQVDLAPGLPWLLGDPVQIQQVLVNLVRNAAEACKAAPQPSPTIALETRADPAGGVEFRVVDNGEGIAADRLDRVFEPFFSTRAEGMGMGLAISRRIVEAHEGRLAVESWPGVRTIFRFTLPSDGISDDRSDGLRRG